MSEYNSRREHLIRLMNESESIIVQDWNDKKILLEMVSQGHVFAWSFNRYALNPDSHYRENKSQ